MVVSLVLAAVLSSSSGAATATQNELRALGGDFDPLRRQFNEDDAKVRVLALLSPT